MGLSFSVLLAFGVEKRTATSSAAAADPSDTLVAAIFGLDKLEKSYTAQPRFHSY